MQSINSATITTARTKHYLIILVKLTSSSSYCYHAARGREYGETCSEFRTGSISGQAFPKSSRLVSSNNSRQRPLVYTLHSTLYSTLESNNTIHRRRIKTEEKAKVVDPVWGTELIKFLATLAILHQDDSQKGIN